MGDPTGIGPELVARVFGQAETFARCRPLAIGAAAVLEQGLAIAKTEGRVRRARDAAETSAGPGDLAVLDLDNIRPDDYRLGERSVAAARAVSEALERAVRLAQEGRLDGVVFAPLNFNERLVGGGPEEAAQFPHQAGHHQLPSRRNCVRKDRESPSLVVSNDCFDNCFDHVLTTP